MDYHGAYQGKSCLVVGGLGFIGSNLAHGLVALGANVSILDALIPESGGNVFNVSDIAGRIRVVIGDVRTQAVTQSVVRGQDFIFNLAGQVSHIDSMRDPQNDMEINCRTHLALLEACRQISPEARLVYSSTRQVYGCPVRLPVTEDHPTSPADINGIHKLAGEMYHRLYHERYELRTSCLRLTNTYGPRMLMRHSRQGFIAWFVRQALEGGCIQLYGTGEQKRDLNEVADVVDALLRMAASEECVGKTYNLGHPRPVSLRCIADWLQEICPQCSARLTPFPPEQKAIDIGDYYGDFTRFQNATGWTPTIDLRDGLENMLRYYACHWPHYWQRPEPVGKADRQTQEHGRQAPELLLERPAA